MAVEPDEGVAGRHRRIRRESLAVRVVGGEIEGAAVPADVVIGEAWSDGLEAVADEGGVFFAFGRGGEGEFDSPVVGKIEGSPVAVVEVGLDKREIAAEVGLNRVGELVGGGVLFSDLIGAGFGEVADFGVVERSASVGGVAKMEAPVEVEAEALSCGVGAEGGRKGADGE